MSVSHIVILVFMLATALVLVTGIVLMMVGGELNKKYSNKLMSLRVTLQGITILLVGALFLMGK